MSNKIRYTTFILLFLFSKIGFSQCAMCKAAVESNLESGGTKGSGINDGILYLMTMPYLIILIFGLLWYLQNKKNKDVLS